MIKPNLPSDIVNNVIVSCEISEQIEFSLNSYGINVNKLYGKFDVSKPIINHPDLYLSHFNESIIFSLKNKYDLCGKLDISDNLQSVNVKSSQNTVLYPDDAILNCVILGDYLICNTKTVSSQILKCAENSGYEMIDVKQGYTKCNICVVDEKSVITEDVGIYKSLVKYGFNVLLLEKLAIRLEGYEYGFIGGASGKISDDKLCFLGNLKLHPEYNEIYRFLFDREVEAVSLSNDPVYDYGSIIPV